jgi:hypothetical protein
MIDPKDFDKIKHMVEVVAARRTEAMEQCVKTILSQLLGREPELEDAKDLNLIQLPVKNPMGDVTYHVEYGEERVFLGVMVVTREAATFNPVMPTGEKPTGKPTASRMARRKMARKIAMS